MGNFVSILQDVGLALPAALTGPPRSLVALPRWKYRDRRIQPPAALIVLLVSAILIIGIRESAGFNTVIVAVKVVVLLLVGFGVAYIKRANWHPFIPPNRGKGRLPARAA